jgi:hypothetical protein
MMVRSPATSSQDPQLSLRWQTRRVSGEVTWFRNAIGRFIFRDPLTAEQIEAEFGRDFDAEDFQVSGSRLATAS